MKAARTFRWIWRINAIAILLVAITTLIAIVTLLVSEMASSRRRASDATAAPAIRQSDAKLRLGPPQRVAGTSFLRAELVSEGSGKSLRSSGSYAAETHNVLFIDTASGACKWLLPSHRRTMAEKHEVFAGDDIVMDRAPLAVAALVVNHGTNTGEVVVFEPTGTTIVTAATNVRSIHGVAANARSGFTLLFERDGNYVTADFEVPSMKKLRETPLRVPQLR